jgi:glutamate/tyrosine decarboxylase-like PLP-dependent enzyme
VDAAYGGPAAAVPRTAALFGGIERADSVVINPHKWMYVPFEAGGVLVKNAEHLRATFSTIPDYLKSDESAGSRMDLMEYNLPLTKEFKALKVWMTIKKYGAQKLRHAIEKDIEKAGRLVDLIQKNEKLEIMAPAPLSIVCFRYNSKDRTDVELDALNDQITRDIEAEGRIFLTGTKIRGRTALRVCFINHRTTLDDVVLITKVVTETGDRLA